MSHRLSTFLKSRRLLKKALDPPPANFEPSWPAILEPSWPAILEPSWPAILEPSWPEILEPSWPAILEPSWPAILEPSWPAILEPSWPAIFVLSPPLPPVTITSNRSSNVTPEVYLTFAPAGTSASVGSDLRRL